MIYDLRNLPDSRGAPQKYPWKKLKEIGDNFEWKNLSDQISIYGAAKKQKIKVSVRKIDKKLLVIRIK